MKSESTENKGFYVGADIGRGFTDIVYGPDQGQEISFPSYVAQGRKLDLYSDRGKPEDNLWVTINGQDWFVGDLAKREGGSREYTKDKGQHQNTLPLLLTGLALTSPNDVIFPNVCVGLPVGDYTAQATKFESALTGTYDIKFKGSESAIVIQKQNIISFPECAAAAWDLILNWDGSIKDQDLANSTIAIGDIGWKTFNFAVLDHLNYRDKMSSTLNNKGASGAFVDFFKRVSRTRDISMATAEDLMRQDGTEELRRLSHEIQDNISMFWPDTKIFDRMILTGRYAPHIIKYMSWPWELHPQTATSNARGNYKIARSQIK